MGMMSSLEYPREAEAADRKAKATSDVQAKKAYETIAAAYRLLVLRAAYQERLQNNYPTH